MKTFKIVALVVFTAVVVMFYVCWQNLIQYLVTDIALLNLEFARLYLSVIYGLWWCILVFFAINFWTGVSKKHVGFLVFVLFVSVIVTVILTSFISLKQPILLSIILPFTIFLTVITLMGNWFEKLLLMDRFNDSARVVKVAGLIFYVLPSVLIGILFLSFHMGSWQNSFDKEVARIVDDGKNHIEGSGYFSGDGPVKYIRFHDKEEALDFANKMYKDGKKLRIFYVIEKQKHIAYDGHTVDGISWSYLKWDQKTGDSVYFLDAKLGFFLPEPELVLFNDNIGIY